VKTHSPFGNGGTQKQLRRLGALAIGLLALNGATLVAHDMWIEPTTFTADPGGIVGARLRVGQDLLGDPLPRDAALINQFVVDDADGRRPLVGRNGADPAGLLRVGTSGLLVIGYRSNPSVVELTAEKFDQYVKEEGLEAAAALRARSGRSGGARDLFSRCAKSLVLSGAPQPRQGDRALGFTLELVAERNPYVLAGGQDLPVRLTYESRPLPGALVVAMNRSAPSDKLSARSDKDGRVTFRLPRSGMWMIKAVHMIPARLETHADWESFWASLTFELPGTDNATARASR
jgi:Domain of unknown function (DUF4198)